MNQQKEPTIKDQELIDFTKQVEKLTLPQLIHEFNKISEAKSNRELLFCELVRKRVIYEIGRNKLRMKLEIVSQIHIPKPKIITRN